MSERRPKTEPTAEIRNMAAIVWQMYVALIDQGFTEEQTLTILGHVIAGSKGAG